MRRIAVLAGLALSITATGCSHSRIRSDVRDGRVNRDRRSLVGLDSMHLYVSSHIEGRTTDALTSDVTAHLTSRFDSAGLAITRSPFVLNAGYVSVWIDGYPANAQADSAHPHIFFGALMQLERYVQIRTARPLTAEDERLSLSATWKKFGLGSCPVDSLNEYTRRLIAAWTDTLLLEIQGQRQPVQ